MYAKKKTHTHSHSFFGRDSKQAIFPKVIREEEHIIQW